MSENLDRYGNVRGAGYRREDYELCRYCRGLRVPNPKCHSCGGYGEVPISRPAGTNSDEVAA